MNTVLSSDWRNTVHIIKITGVKSNLNSIFNEASVVNETVLADL